MRRRRLMAEEAAGDELKIARVAARTSMADEVVKAGMVDVDQRTGEPTPAARTKANMRALLAAEAST